MTSIAYYRNVNFLCCFSFSFVSNLLVDGVQMFLPPTNNVLQSKILSTIYKLSNEIWHNHLFIVLSCFSYSFVFNLLCTWSANVLPPFNNAMNCNLWLNYKSVMKCI